MSKKKLGNIHGEVTGGFAGEAFTEGSPKLIPGAATGITTHKRLEETNQAPLKELESIYLNAPIGLALIDRELRFFRINKRLAEINGISAEAHLGRRLREIVPHIADQAEAVFRQVFETGEPVLDVELKGETAAQPGVVRHWNESWYPLKNDAGETVSISVVVEEITESKKGKAALRESEQRCRLATQTSKIGIWEWNVLTDEIRWDTQMFAIYGVEPTADGLINYTIWREAVLPEDLPGQEAVLRETVKNSGNSRREFRIRRSNDGELRYIEAVETVRTNPKGEAEWVVGTNIDVTTRQETEKNLRENKERFEIVKDSAEVGFWFCDLPFDVLVWDNRVKEHFWLPPDREVTIDIFYEQLHPDDRERTRRAIDESIADRTQYDIEYRTVASDGREKWIRAIGRTFYDAQGDPIRFDGVTLDITERKRREENAAFLADIAEDFARLTTADEILQVVGDKTARYLDISNCLFAEIDEERDEVNVIYAWRGEANSRELIGIYRLSDYVTKEFQNAARRGEPVVVRNTQTDERTNAQAYAEFDIHSFVSVPFRRSGKWKYLFTVNHNSARDWRADEIELVKDLTGRVFPRLERARAEEALKKSEAEFRRLANAVPQIVWVTDAAGKIEYVNDIWTKFSGLNAEETATPEIVAEIIHPEDCEKVFGEWLRAFESGESYQVEARMKEAATGDYCWFLMRSEPTKDEAGKVIKWFGTSTDITDRKRTEQELAVHQRLYQSITDNATTALFIMDEKQHCAFMNPAAEKLTGYSLAETIGRTLHDVVHHTRPDGSPFPLSECPIDQAFPTRNQMQGEEIFVHKNGYFYDVAFTASPLLDENGKAVGTVIEVQDITHRKEAEREREKLLVSEKEARQQAESANRLKDEFLATVSHELRTPLNAIYGWATMVRNSQYDYDIMRRAFEVVERSARNQNQIISDILDVSRIITGKLNLNLQPIALSQVIFAAVDTVRPAIDAKEIRLEVQLDPDAEIITGDADRLQQIFWNLLSNAVKFTPESGKIKVSINCVGDYAELSVVDNGAGIEAVSAEDIEQEVVPQRLLTGLKILVVDDEPDALELTEFILTGQGALVFTAESAAEALEIFDKEIVDVVISDIGMPHKDGYELIQELCERQNKKNRLIPTIALTAYAGEEDNRRVLESGFKAYLPKPVEAAYLVEVIAGLTDRLRQN